MSSCHGNGDDHCCWLNGKACRFLGENVVPGRRWACTLLVELGDWAKVHDDPRYRTHVQPFWDGYPIAGLACGDWPQTTSIRQCCYAEGDG